MQSKLKTPKKSRSSKRVATIATLMTACIVTLIGVAKGLEPDVILLRCVVAGIAIGVPALLATTVFSTLISNHTDK